METHRVWEGNWDGDGAYNSVEFVGEKIGEYACEDNDGVRGFIYRVYRTERGILIHLYDWSKVEGDCASIFEYSDLDEAARCGFRQVLRKIRII